MVRRWSDFLPRQGCYCGLLLITLAITVTGCHSRELQAVGQLLSDRVEVLSKAEEKILSFYVVEGDNVEAGQLLLIQDPARVEALLEENRAAVANLEAVLDEQITGPRKEEIDAARANLERLQAQLDLSKIEFQRQQTLAQRGLNSKEDLDQARAQMESSQASVAGAQANLDELLAGTRPEELQQTREQLAEARARVAQVEIQRQDLIVRAPTAGVVDSLPFRLGEEPSPGRVVAVLLSGQQPYARVYVPEPIRVRVQVGDPATVHVDGVSTPLHGQVYRIASEGTFTPYFALTERDRGRLSYVADVTILDYDRRLPDGVPVQVSFGHADSTR